MIANAMHEVGKQQSEDHIHGLYGRNERGQCVRCQRGERCEARNMVVRYLTKRGRETAFDLGGLVYEIHCELPSHRGGIPH